MDLCGIVFFASIVTSCLVIRSSAFVFVDQDSQKLTQIWEKVQHLDTLEARLDRIESKLDTLLPSGTTQEQHASTTQAPEVLPEINCVDLVSIERTQVDDGTQFTLRFTKNAEEVKIAWRDQDGKIKDADLIEEAPPNLFSTTFTTAMNASDVWVSIYDVKLAPDGITTYQSSMISLFLTVDTSNTTLEFTADLPIIHVTPSHPAVYQIGKNVTITANTPIQKYPDGSRSDHYIMASFSGRDIRSGDYEYDMQNLLYLSDLERVGDNRTERNVTIFTSRRPVNGFLDLCIIQREAHEVLRHLQISRYIPVYPANETTSLPTGYLSIANNPRQYDDQYNMEVSPCTFGETCHEYCTAVGNGISDIAVFSIDGKGGFERVSNVTIDLMPGTPFTFATWEVTPAAPGQYEDIPGFYAFVCYAHDSTGLEVSRLRGVKFHS